MALQLHRLTGSPAIPRAHNPQLFGLDGRPNHDVGVFSFGVSSLNRGTLWLYPPYVVKTAVVVWDSTAAAVMGPFTIYDVLVLVGSGG